MMAEVKNAPTAEHLAAFDSYVAKWQTILGLDDWRIERSTRKTKNMAEVQLHYPNRLAVYRVGPFGSATINDQTLESTALHEVLHILLAELVNQSAYGITGEALDSAEHRVVHVLEKLLLKD